MNTSRHLATALLVCLASAAHAQVAVVAAAKSGATAMTADQAANLWLGKSDSVPGLGKAVLLEQAEASPARAQFYSKVLGKTPAQVKAAWTRLVFSGKAQMPKELPSDDEVKKFLAAHPDAVGYIDKGAVDGSVKVLLSVN